ncbi:ABC transporter ATP-binding protein [Aminobacter sp. BA135]|uniref:ABC transporter ATP-binding protein n=1 Tax=Aminobacter sp. BA135 TaxID=537596 RepID=UPI003D79FEFD
MTAPATEQSARPLVEVRDLNVRFETRDRTVHAVNGVSFEVMPGEVLCIIGESGSGKSVTMRALMRLFSPRITRVSGNIRVAEHDIMSVSERQLSDIRGSTISMVFQEPMTALDPTYTIGDQIAETIIRHQHCSHAEAMAKALELLQFVKVPNAERRLKAYPHELSGGLRQRAMIAVALSCRPKLLLADEPTTALDATVQIQVLLLLRKLQQELGMGVIFVTHDLGVAAQIADKVAVMYAGRIVEYGSVRDVLLRPSHPYTMGMLASTVHGQDRDTDIDAIPGTPPDMSRLADGCSFAPRCRFAVDAVCGKGSPPLVSLSPGRETRCFRAAELFARPALATSSSASVVHAG